MGYRIEYQPVKKIRGAQRQRTMTPALICICLLLFLLLVNSLWPKGADFLREYVFSESQKAAVIALDRLVSDLQEGASFSATIDAFCENIFSHAQNTND